MILADKTKRNLLILSWALYDLSNQFFALNVVTLYFPRWLTIENSVPEIYYGLSFGLSMLLVAVCAPFLGIIADMKNRHRKFLIFFTAISIIFTISLGFTKSIPLALLFFAIANFGCQEAVIFYNSLMIKVAPSNRIGLVSGLGRMFGYSGAIIALLLTRPIINKMGYQMTFIVTGIFFLIFALPCLLFVKDKSEETGPHQALGVNIIKEATEKLIDTIFTKHMFENLKDFLKAVFCLFCAVNTVIIFISVYATKVFHLTTNQVIDLMAISTFFAIASSIVSGYLSDIIGQKRTLMGVYLLWLICILAGGIVRPPFHWIIGPLAGVSIGATWVVCRAIIIKLTPSENLGEAFGLFNFVGYLSGIVGPVFMGLMLLYFSKMGAVGYRISFLSLLVFVLAGIGFLIKMGRASSS